MSDGSKRSRLAFYFERQAGVCSLRRTVECLQVSGEMDITKRRAPHRATWDHVVPKSEGGRNAFNLLLACEQCNHDRGSIHPAAEGSQERAAALWAEWIAHLGLRPQVQQPLAPRAPKPKPKPKRKIDLVALGWDMEDGMGRREIEQHMLGQRKRA